MILPVFEDCTRFEARVRSVVYGLQRSLLGYYVNCTAQGGDDLKPVVIAGGQLGHDRQATRGGGEPRSEFSDREAHLANKYRHTVSYVTLHDLVATLTENTGRYTSMTTLFVNLTRLISEDAAVLSDTELDELALIDETDSQDTSFAHKKRLAQAQLVTRRNGAAMEARVALRESPAGYG